MEWWKIFALLAAGAVGVGSLASSSAKAAAQSNDLDLVNRAFQAAMSSESDMNVLKTFSAKLRAAGFTTYADALDVKVTKLSRGSSSAAVLATRGIYMVPRAQTAPDGSTYSKVPTP
jgi:hypothetical protein